VRGQKKKGSDGGMVVNCKNETRQEQGEAKGEKGLSKVRIGDNREGRNNPGGKKGSTKTMTSGNTAKAWMTTLIGGGDTKIKCKRERMNKTEKRESAHEGLLQQKYRLRGDHKGTQLLKNQSVHIGFEGRQDRWKVGQKKRRGRRKKSKKGNKTSKQRVQKEKPVLGNGGYGTSEGRLCKKA